jgi:hypothetical protein
MLLALLPELKVIIESDNGADQLNYASLVHATFEYDSI